ncbi:hypothetical protein F4861DRAFT_507270 [Xylaria intraflava]|nr:hypothetical protein F4861DRAFT_507270 [Xylaria intraflava]
MASEAPYKPDEKETTGYYYGFSGRPRLVARTSTNRWCESQHIEGWDTIRQIPKRYAAITEDELISAWTRDVSQAIIEALKPCRWNYFFPIQTGLKHVQQPVNDTQPPEDTFKTVLLVAVEPGSLAWDAGLGIAQECLRVLERFHILGVQVEILEGRYQHQAASRQLEANILPGYKSINKKVNERLLPMLSSLGYPITYLNNPTEMGTVGLHLRLGNKKTLYALTCRHVVHSDRTKTESYSISEGQHRQHHIQGSDQSVSNCLGEIEFIQREMKELREDYQDRKDRWEQQYMHDEAFKHRRPLEEDDKTLEELQNTIAYNEKITDCLEEIREKEKRIIGHLAYHPILEVSSKRPEYLKDWALIELDPAKFLGAPENKVYIADGDMYLSDDDGFRTLRQRDPGVSRSTKTVAKRGMQTGLTRGTISGIEAIVRHPALGATDYTRELVIVPDRKHDKFSGKGDSGACVFDINGYVVGLVVGSTDGELETWQEGSPGVKERRHETDVTFAAPIESVFADIRDFTGEEPQLA